MLKRWLGRDKPISPTIERPERQTKTSRWAAVMPPLGRQVRVLRLERETPDAVTVYFEPTDGRPLDFLAGQYLTHCLEIDGQILRRAYSLAVAPGVGELAFTCKAVAGGQVSNYLCAQLRVGATYEVRGPSGQFLLVPGDTPLLFVAAGSGITPVISLLESALQQSAERQIDLIYGSRDAEHIIFRARLDDLCRRHRNLHVHHVLSQADARWAGLRGRVDTGRVLELARSAATSEAYLCGPGAMMDALAAGLVSAGLAPVQIHREDFRAVNHAVQPHPRTPQPITFRRSGTKIQQQPGQSVLDAALAHGVDLNFSCTVGGCAACKIRLISGQVTLDEPHCLDESELAQGYTLACCAYALEPIEVDA